MLGYQEMGSSSSLLVVLIIAVLPANGMPARAVMDCPYSAGSNCQGLIKQGPTASVLLGNRTEMQIPGHY